MKLTIEMDTNHVSETDLELMGALKGVCAKSLVAVQPPRTFPHEGIYAGCEGCINASTTPSGWYWQGICCKSRETAPETVTPTQTAPEVVAPPTQAVVDNALKPVRKPRGAVRPPRALPHETIRGGCKGCVNASTTPSGWYCQLRLIELGVNDSKCKDYRAAPETVAPTQAAPETVAPTQAAPETVAPTQAAPFAVFGTLEKPPMSHDDACLLLNDKLVALLNSGAVGHKKAMDFVTKHRFSQTIDIAPDKIMGCLEEAEMILDEIAG